MTRSVARKATSLIVPATVAVVMLGPSHAAHAEPLRPSIPTVTWASGIVSTPAFSASAIGVSGQASFRSSVRFGSSAAPSEPWSLCIGPACPRHGRSTPAGGERIFAPTGSLHFLSELGPVGVKALGLFANPVATSARPVVMRVAPMFACGGGGVEMRAAWW